MSAAMQATDGSRTAWWPARRVKALRCVLRGHSWTAQPSAGGFVIMLCSRCSEMVVAGFVDVPDVAGLAASEGHSWLGVPASARLAVDLAAAHVDLDDAARVRLRRDAIGRPGDSVDALAQLAAVLSRMVEPGRPLRALQQVALRVEASTLEYELTSPGGAWSGVGR